MSLLGSWEFMLSLVGESLDMGYDDLRLMVFSKESIASFLELKGLAASTGCRV
jgi:hypothetical protein